MAAGREGLPGWGEGNRVDPLGKSIQNQRDLTRRRVAESHLRVAEGRMAWFSRQA